MPPTRQDLIESYVCLAHHLVKRVGHWSLGDDDLFQSAMMGVIEAVDTFDPSLNVPLAAHVINHVKYALCGDVIRARRHTQTQPYRFCEPPHPDDDGDYADLYDAIEQLPVADQSIIMDFWGLNGRRHNRAELATRHNRTIHQISESTTRSTKSLRAALTA